MSIIITNIKALIQTDAQQRTLVAGKEMATLPLIESAWIFIDNEIIKDFGSMEPDSFDKVSILAEKQGITHINAVGKMVLPAFCDSHTHLVYAGSREMEFVDKIRGLSYEEIAKRGGGILNSARRLQDTDESELIEQALGRLNEIMLSGTGAVEIKSGYGLNTESELKMLRVIRKLKDLSPLTIKATFLGAHAVPSDYKHRQNEYVDLVINEMIPLVAGEGLADFIDVFCERGFFTPAETERMLMTGIKYGLKPKIHANELAFSGGIQVGVKYQALSVDHLECTGSEEIDLLLKSDTMPTLLPGSALFLGLDYPPARKMIDAGLPVALASDYNPGSSPSGNMQLVMSLAAILLKMLPEEIIHAVTINGAYAMGVEDILGSIAVGKKANLIITKPIPSLAFIPYAYGSNKVETIIINGRII
ncbi:MAG TPA: imidazolonepropionase [Bacteroidales bacterium]|nr:imidazolonepropionase [Bacteroidales bacterium]